MHKMVGWASTSVLTWNTALCPLGSGKRPKLFSQKKKPCKWDGSVAILDWNWCDYLIKQRTMLNLSPLCLTLLVMTHICADEGTIGAFWMVNLGRKFGGFGKLWEKGGQLSCWLMLMIIRSLRGCCWRSSQCY